MIAAVLVLILQAVFTVWAVRKGLGKTAGREEATFWDRLWSQYTLGCRLLFSGTAEKHMQERKMNEALLKTKDERFKELRNLYGAMWLMVFVGGIAGVVIAVQARGNPSVRSILRPQFGEEKQVVLQVEGLVDTDEVTIAVSGRDPSEEEMEAIFDEAFEEVQAEMLNGNESFEAVQYALEVPERTSAGIRVTCVSAQPEAISDRGFIMAKEIPVEGIEAAMEVTLAYGAFEKHYSLPMVILPVQVEFSEEERLLAEIRAADQASLELVELQLPERFEGQAIEYREEGASPYPVLLMAIGGAGAYYAAAQDSRKKKYKARAEELKDSFPGMLTKVSTLISAGMSTRGAWLRVAEDYRKTLQADEKNRKYVYEEMLITARQLLNGQPEGEAYVQFGKRCESPTYVRFGNLLAKNLRQGIAGMKSELQEEMQSALNEKRQNALRRGEEAGTKMLFPMILMLGVVLVTVAAPAFLAF